MDPGLRRNETVKTQELIFVSLELSSSMVKIPPAQMPGRSLDIPHDDQDVVRALGLEDSMPHENTLQALPYVICIQVGQALSGP